MGLILREIFRNIPTKSLLASCSLVNKLWNTEARKVARDNRQCYAENTLGPVTFEFLREFDRLCHQMTSNGRVIPFNPSDYDSTLNLLLGGPKMVMTSC